MYTNAPIAPPAHHPMLSIVVPMYNESEGVDVFFATLCPILSSITLDWEIICINDGSSDDTLMHLKHHAAADHRIKFVSLSRNFGKEAALTAGLHHAFGQAVIPIDADLQDPPELIPDMVAKWQEGYKVVLATRSKRDGDSFFKRTTARVFYKLMGNLTRFHIPANTGDFRLMDAEVVSVIRLLPERSRFMKGLFAWVGFTSTTIYFERKPRAKGEAKQSYRSLWELAKDGIFSFTTLPLRLTTYLGALISLVSFSYAVFLILRTLIFGVDVGGYASTMVAILCIGGIQLLSIGIIGEYIGRIYRETKQRPLYVVEEKGGL
jgi:glycosyltransferase involved in cell wall biosynthesis